MFASADMVVEEQARRDSTTPAATPSGAAGTKRSGQMICGAIAQQHLALLQAFAHQAELVVLQIAQAAVDELRRT